MDEIKDAKDDIDDGKLVIIRKDLTLTPLINHYILSQLFIMVKFH